MSEIAHYRVGDVRDELQEGDQVLVKVINVDPSGKVRLSRKALLPVPTDGSGSQEGSGDKGRGGSPGGGGGTLTRKAGTRQALAGRADPARCRQPVGEWRMRVEQPFDEA